MALKIPMVHYSEHGDERWFSVPLNTNGYELEEEKAQREEMQPKKKRRIEIHRKYDDFTKTPPLRNEPNNTKETTSFFFYWKLDSPRMNE